jgi:hypothetical protein
MAFGLTRAAVGKRTKRMNTRPLPTFARKIVAGVILPLIATAGATSLAQQPLAPPYPSVVSTNFHPRFIAPGVLELGLVRLDQNRRSVMIPAFVNLKEGVIEYFLVTSGGKTHESVLRTDAEPHHIHVAMLLLGARGSGTNELPADPALALPGDEVTVEVIWKKGTKERRVRAEKLVLDRKRKAAMSKGDWTYTGSRFREDGFAAQADGSIISLITDDDALVNNPRPGREDDDRWLSKAKDLPDVDQPVEVIITLRDRLRKR